MNATTTGRGGRPGLARAPPPTRHNTPTDDNGIAGATRRI